MVFVRAGFTCPGVARGTKPDPRPRVIELGKRLKMTTDAHQYPREVMMSLAIATNSAASSPVKTPRRSRNLTWRMNIRK